MKGNDNNYSFLLAFSQNILIREEILDSFDYVYEIKIRPKKIN